MTVYGHLNAIGTADERITFTSLSDSGDRGQWRRIYVSGPSASADLRYADVRYGGYDCCGGSNSYGVLTSYGADVTVDETLFARNQHSAIFISRGNNPGWPKATVTNSLLSDNGLGISTLDAWAEVRGSVIQKNAKEGLYALHSSTYSGPPTAIYDSDIARNGAEGVDLGLVSSSTPAAAWPKGSRNNIYDNDRQSAPPYQLRATKNIPATVDWTGNFWGDDVRYASNPGGCTPTYAAGRLEHEGSTATPKNGPFWRRSYLVYVNGQWITCLQDYPALGPDDFEPEYIEHDAHPNWNSMYGAELRYYTPILKYDTDEGFWAVSPGALTDFYLVDDLAETNQLKAGSDAFAFSNPAYSESSPDLYGHLTLGYLGASYPNYVPSRGSALASPDDYVSARSGDGHGSYLGDFYDMYSRSGYPDRIYGRVAYGGNDGRLWLQYWIFYTHNPWSVLGIGEHEGDWEMIQVGLDDLDGPELAAYAQHDNPGGQRCDWTYVEKDALGRPKVYVALGSHASYFNDVDVPAYDRADGRGLNVELPILDVISDTSPGWIDWPGRWGDSDGSNGGSRSPDGPKFNTSGLEWADPSAWASGLDTCF